MYKIGLERLLQEVAQYCNDMGFSQKTCDLIFDAFSAPARNVAAGYGNVSGRDNSAKMGIVVQWESNKVERPLQHKIENDIRALFYADQVGPYKVAYRRRDGHNATWTHTPDCLVCYEDEAGFVEFKPTKELERLSVVHPDRYARRDGKWVCPAGERFAAQYGLFYRIWTSDDIDWNQERNIRFLESYLQFKRPVEKTVSEEIIAVCDANFGISLKDVLEKYDADDVYALIAAGIIYCDLCSAPIAEPDRVRLFSCREKGEGFKVLASSPSASSVIRITAFKVEPGACLEWNGSTWIIGSVEEGAICIVDGQGHILQLPNAAFEKLVNEDALKPEKVAMENGAPQEVQEILRKSSPKDMKTADFRLAAIRYLLDGKVGHDTHSNMSPRVRRHWMKLYKNAERNWGYGFIGLIPKPRGRKLDAEQLAKEDIQFALDVIKEYYDNVRARNAYTAYAIYKKKCADDGKAPVSDQTFYSMIKHRDLYEQELARRGKKAAYPFKPYQDQWDEALPIHGDYPWQYVHTDHTKADIRFRDPDTGRVLTRRATISTLFDAFSRRVLVVLITMEAPSALTMLTLIRECVRRHGRLPANIIHDGGVEFGSTDFQKLCARLGIALMKRPPSESRFGSVIERNFHTMTTQLIHNLLGNTKIMKNVREVHPSVNPENLAIWDLESFIQEMEYYCYEKYDRDEHSTLRQSPREAFAEIRDAEPP